jgi:hypothetical protein
VEKRKISLPCRESKPDRPAYSSSLYRLSYPGSYIPDAIFKIILLTRFYKRQIRPPQ